MKNRVRFLCNFAVLAAFAFAPASALATVVLTSDPAGGGLSHENHQPGLGLNYLVAMSGAYPSSEGGAHDGPDRYVGEITMFAGTFEPEGWAFANGQTLPVSQHDVLFSLFGTIYGGDGETTLKLPDLRGRSTMNAGQGTGLTNRFIGSTAGVDAVTLTTSQMPVHTHPIPSINRDTTPSGGGLSHTNMKPSVAINYFLPETGGEVRMAGFNFTPNEHYDANGQLLQVSPTNIPLLQTIGTTYGGNGLTNFALPDLTGRLAMHEGQGAGLTSRTLGTELGVEAVTLTTDTMPTHTHGAEVAFADVGGDQAHENMQPTSTLNYIIATSSSFDYPFPEGGVTPWTPTNSRTPFMGEVRLFAGLTAPTGWDFADGQTVQVSQNSALFSILGTLYGGDGESTFKLPDLRGRVPVHVGGHTSSGPLRVWTLGEKDGDESVALTLNELPSHSHDYITDPPSGDLNGDGFIGIDDLNLVLGNWNQTIPPGNTLADPSGDGFVGIDDLNVVLGNWNAGTPPPPGAGATIPEPASLVLLGISGVMLIRCRCAA